MIPTLPNGEPQKPQPAARADAPRQPRPHPPRASLGRPARGGLFVSSVYAGVGFVVLFAGLTLGPYFWEKSQANATPAPAEKGGPAAPAANQPAVAPAPSTPDPAAVGKLSPNTPNTVGKAPGKGDIVDKLGENGTKAAPAKVNPLDKKDDDILKDIK